MHQEMQSSSSDDGKRTSRQNTFARTWCAIQARWHNTEYPRRATLESINPIMCVKHRSRRPSLGRRILFIIYSEDNSQQRCAFGHDSVITKNRSSRRFFEVTSIKNQPHTQAQEETAQAIKQRARQNTSGLSWAALLQNFLFPSHKRQSRSRSRRRRTLLKVCCTIFCCSLCMF